MAAVLGPFLKAGAAAIKMPVPPLRVLRRATKRYPAARLLALSLLLGAAVVLPMGMVSSAAAIFALALLLGLVSGGALH
jgi:hypothetical protein